MSLESEKAFREKYPEMYEKYKWADPIVAQYPELFKETASIPVGQGWEEIIKSLLSIIDHHVINLPEEIRSQVFVSQIKEKFGGLRFYMSHETPFIRGAISMAEYLSNITCERCSAKGKKHNVSGWITCLCDSCLVQAEEDRKKEKAYVAKKAKK